MNEFRYRQEQTKNSLLRFKKKWENYKRTITEFDNTIADLEKRIDFLTPAMAAAQEQAVRLANRENVHLKREIAELQKMVKLKESIDHHGLGIGCTWAVFEFIFGHIARENRGIRMALDSAIFGSLIPSLMAGDENYIVESLPSTYLEAISEGRDVASLVLSEAPTSLLEEPAWNEYAPLLQDWVQDNLLPLTFGFALDPHTMFSYENMILWDVDKGERDVYFPEVYDCMDLYRRHKSAIFKELDLPSAEKEVVKNLY